MTRCMKGANGEVEAASMPEGLEQASDPKRTHMVHHKPQKAQSIGKN